MKSAAQIVFAAAMLAACSATAAETLHLAGDGETLWLAMSEEGVYSLAARPAGRQWEKLLIQSARGQIRALAAIDDSAVVFFTDGGNLRYDHNLTAGFRGIKPPGELWPADTELLTACAAGEPNGSLLVLATRPIRTEAATGPATAAALHSQPQRLELVLFSLAAGQWQELSTYRPAQLPTRAHMVKLPKRLYVLLGGPPLSFLAVEAATWQPLPPPPVEKAKPLALARAGKKVLLVAAGLPRPDQVCVVGFEKDKWLPASALRTKDGPLAWAQHSPPAVAGVGQGLAILWQEEKGYAFASAGADGLITARSADIFYKSRAAETINQILGIFFWVVPLMMIALMLWPGQPMRTAPFALPPRLRAAGPLKRLAAFAIDAVPFLIAIAAATGQEELAELRESMPEGLVTLRGGAIMLGAMAAFPIYCIVLERLFGATLGKLALGLRVVGQDGRRASLRELALRNISKILELAVFPFLFVPLLTRYHQRLGDKVAWTAVIDLQWSQPPTEPPSDSSDTSEER